MGQDRAKAPATVGAFEVWTEIRCHICLCQIAGEFCILEIPHARLKATALGSGARLFDSQWRCRSCQTGLKPGGRV